MIRRLFTAAAVLSLLLGVVLAVLFVASYQHTTIRVHQIDELPAIEIWRGELLKWRRVTLAPTIVNLHILWRVRLWPFILAAAVLPLTWAGANRGRIIFLLRHPTRTDRRRYAGLCPWWNWSNLLMSHAVGSYVAVGVSFSAVMIVRGPDVTLLIGAAAAPVIYPLLLLFTIQPFLDRPSAARICLVVLLYAVPFAAWSTRADRRWRRARCREADECRACGYNLTGNVSGVCPECGTPIESNAGEPA
ncbi:MAG TPA: hypothetical protein VGI81_01010 [Tepidisphaeraceae bacterium]|jgi:hypothetical protein